MVTAETMTVLPFLVLVAMTLVWVVSLGVTHMRVADASREGARLVARGEPVPQVRRAVRGLLPGATVRVASGEGRARVEVRLRSSLPLVPRARITLASTSTAALE